MIPSLKVYQGKPNKNVIILSNSLYPSVQIDMGEKKIPEPVEFYNSTKFGVDILDQMARKYSVRAGTRRWPMHVFYVLDIAVINSWVVYRKITAIFHVIISYCNLFASYEQNIKKIYNLLQMLF